MDFGFPGSVRMFGCLCMQYIDMHALWTSGYRWVVLPRWLKTCTGVAHLYRLHYFVYKQTQLLVDVISRWCLFTICVIQGTCYLRWVCTARSRLLVVFFVFANATTICMILEDELCEARVMHNKLESKPSSCMGRWRDSQYCCPGRLTYVIIMHVVPRSFFDCMFRMAVEIL